MSVRIHESNPAELVEKAFFRIQRVQMADVPILNPALSVEAVDFQRWQGHWLGVLVTPWCMSLLRLPGSTEAWTAAGDNQRCFIRFPAGDFAFLGGHEPELGSYLSCPLFSPMERFGSQKEASLTARASLMALFTAPGPAADADAAPSRPAEEASLSRRRFLSLG